jgi:hypothetical protein
MTAPEKDWKESAALWERRSAALRGIVELLEYVKVRPR